MLVTRSARLLAIDGGYIHVRDNCMDTVVHSFSPGELLDYATSQQGKERLRQWQDGFV